MMQSVAAPCDANLSDATVHGVPVYFPAFVGTLQLPAEGWPG